MADKKISELVEATVLADTDVFPVVDSGASATKRVTFDTLATEVRTNAEPLTATTIAVSDGGTIGSASDADAMSIAAGGDVTFSQDIIASGSVFLGGTAAANALDDYEEGTWTPVVYDAISGGNAASASISVGRYIKIGGLVQLEFWLENITTTGLTAGNVFYIRGLPFLVASGIIVTGSAGASAVTTSDNIYLVVNASSQNRDGIRFFEKPSGGGNHNGLIVSDISSGTGDLLGTLMYRSA